MLIKKHEVSHSVKSFSELVAKTDEMFFPLQSLPIAQLPEVFGMHDNVDVSKELQETRQLFDSVLLTQGKADAGGHGKTDDSLFKIASDILAKVREIASELLTQIGLSVTDQGKTISD